MMSNGTKLRAQAAEMTAAAGTAGAGEEKQQPLPQEARQESEKKPKRRSTVSKRRMSLTRMAKNQDEFVVTGSGIKLAKDIVDQKSVAPQTDAQRHVRKCLWWWWRWWFVAVVVLTFVVVVVVVLLQARNCGS